MIILVLCAAALVIRAFFGFCSSDEPFYLSTTKRLFEGDLIFVHEWFPTQLSSIILLPFYALFVTITGGTTGIILFFRILYIFVTLIISIISFRIIKTRTGTAAAFCIALFMLFYAHLNIAALSYYTMSFEFFVFAMLLLTVNNKGSLITGGFMLALSVLALPSLVIGVILLWLTGLAFSIRYKELRSVVFFSAVGMAAALLLFVIYIYATGNSIGNLIKYLPYVLSDDEHQTSVVAPFKKFFTSITDVYGRFWYASFALAALGLAANRFKNLIPFIFAADCMFFIYYAVLSLGHTGYMNTALALFAAPLFFMCEKKDIRVFVTLFLGGLIVSMTYSYSSNGELYVLSIGHGIACVAGILFIFGFMKEHNKILQYTVIAVLCLFLLQTSVLRFINVYRDAPLNRLDTKISAGPAAGLMTTKEHHDTYMSVLSDINRYKNKSSYVLFSKLLPWGYLACDAKAAAPSTWRNMISSERLAEYYGLYPEKTPDLVFVLNTYVGSYDSCGDIEADPSPNENEFEGPVAEMLDNGSYEMIESDSCTIYVQR
ncbi:MAG: hypothetical protein J5829_05870 [Lachnospiraceae bacterium]|nr:hypothetical protein [Lachnospiraceae bacterium]